MMLRHMLVKPMDRIPDSEATGIMSCNRCQVQVTLLPISDKQAGALTNNSMNTDV